MRSLFQYAFTSPGQEERQRRRPRHPRWRTTAAKKRASKTKFTCPECGQNAWAKPDASLICGKCEETMLAEELTEGQGDEQRNGAGPESRPAASADEAPEEQEY